MNTWTLLVLVACAQSDTAGADSLAIWPDNIGRQVRENVGARSKPLGYTAQEMANFPGYTHRLGYVSQLFRDAEQVPVETDRLARRMIDGGFETAVRTALGILGSKIAVDDFPLDATSEIPLDAASEIVPVDAASKATWDSLPGELRRAVEQLVRGAMAARPQLHEAFDWNSLARQVGDAEVNNLGAAQVYNYAAAPWLGYSYGGTAPFAALSTFRSTPLGNAGALFLSAVRSAVRELMAVPKDAPISRV